MAISKRLLLISLALSVAVGREGIVQPKIPQQAMPSAMQIDVKRQVEKLYSSDPVERASAAYRLGEMGLEASDAVPFLVAILHDREAFQCKEPLRRTDYHGRTDPGCQAATALGKIGKPAVEPLIQALKSKCWHTRRGAARALGATKDIRAIKPLILVLKSPGQSAIGSIAEKSLANIGEPAIDPLIASFASQNPNLQESAANVLTKIGKPTVEPLIAKLKDDDPDIRRAAARVLGWIKDNRAVEPLITLLKDEDVRVRAWAATSLGTIGDTHAIAPLVGALNDEDSRVRCSVVLALGHLKDSRVVEPLVTALSDEDERVRADAGGELAGIGKQAVQPLINALETGNANARAAAALALGPIGDREAVNPLIIALNNESWEVRARAACSLGEINDSAAVEALITALDDENIQVRYIASYALRRITGKKYGQDWEKWKSWWQDSKQQPGPKSH